MAGGGGGGSLWVWILAAGAALCGVAYWLESAHMGSEVLIGALLALGGLSVIFGSCESMIVSVEAVGERLRWNQFVAGTMAGLAANLPEVVMLAFVVRKDPRVAFVVVLLTIHVSALAFGIYSGLLPRDKQGQARLPKPLVHLSTDLYACAAGVFFAMGALMIVMHTFEAGDTKGAGLTSGDLLMIGAGLLLVQVVNVTRLIKRFSSDDPTDDDDDVVEGEVAAAGAEPAGGAQGADAGVGVTEEAKADSPGVAPVAGAPSWGRISFFGLLGIGTSVIGGHAVGEFAEILVKALTARGYSEMIGAIILSVVACAGCFLMIATAHAKRKYEIAIANVSGAVTQQPFVVLPMILILTAVFASTGVLTPDQLPAGGGVLAIDFETTSVVFFAFPTLLMLWKAVQDDGYVNWLETASMIALFAMVIFFLAQHG